MAGLAQSQDYVANSALDQLSFHDIAMFILCRLMLESAFEPITVYRY